MDRVKQVLESPGKPMKNQHALMFSKIVKIGKEAGKVRSLIREKKRGPCPDIIKIG